MAEAAGAAALVGLQPPVAAEAADLVVTQLTPWLTVSGTRTEPAWNTAPGILVHPSQAQCLAVVCPRTTRGTSPLDKMVS